MQIDSLDMMLRGELKGLYDVEKRLTKAIPKLMKRATDGGLRSALESHLAETETHVSRIEQAFDLIGEPAKTKSCAAIKGLIDEGDEHLSNDYGSDVLRDVAIVGAAQRVEHYEMAAYGNAIAHARQIGANDVADLLEDTLAEEKAADKKLTDLGRPLNATATHRQGEDEPAGFPGPGTSNGPASGRVSK